MARACLLASILALGALLTLAACGSDDSSSGTPSNTGGQAGSGGGTAGGAGDGGQAGSAGSGTGGGAGQAGSGGSAGPSLEASCQASCDKMVAAGCSAAPTADVCWSGCMNTFAPIPNCQAQAIAMLDCAGSTGTVTCDANGQPVSSGCEAQTVEVNKCVVCEPLAEDGPCKLCGKQKCCNEAQALVAEPTTADYVACAQACADTACVNTCKSSYPAAAAATQAAAQCVSSQCATQCGT